MSCRPHQAFSKTDTKSILMIGGKKYMFGLWVNPDSGGLLDVA